MSTWGDVNFSERSEKYLCGIALKLLKNVNFDIRIIKLWRKSLNFLN